MIDLDTIFRSIINFKNKDGKPTLPQRDLVKNFRYMQQVVPKAPDEKAYNRLYHFILDYLRNCDSDQPELPSYEFIRKHFETIEGNEAVLAVLEKVKAQTPYLGQDYKTILKAYNDDQNILLLEKILSDTDKIATTGMDLGRGRNKKEIKGITDAISYFARETKDLRRNLTGIKTEGQIVSSEDSGEMVDEYKKAETDPMHNMGIRTWLNQIDDHTEGIRNTELWLIAAFTGHCKTTFSYNMAYRALFGGWNTGYITLEQSYTEIRRHLYVMHACNPIFKDIFPEYADLVGHITYNDVEYGRLNEREREYWLMICKDFDRNVNQKSDHYGRSFIWQPPHSTVTTADVSMQMDTWQQELKAEGKGSLELLIVDYISLMGATASEKSRDHNETQNNIIKSLKRLCNTFNNGGGTRMISPFQINRAGYREALANEGRYYLTALSNAHEAERSADVVMSLFKFDEENDNNRLKICNLKNRRNDPFNPFDACINFETGFIYNFAGIVEDSDKIDFSGLV